MNRDDTGPSASTRKARLEQALEQLVRMYRCLAIVYEDVFPLNRDNFGLLAEGDLDQIRQLEATIADLGGRREAEAYELRRWGGPTGARAKPDSAG